jgi:hypothetical protein
VSKTKTFDGLSYAYDSDWSTKDEAKKAATEHRRNKFRARVVKSIDVNLDGTPQYSVYTRRS